MLGVLSRVDEEGAIFSRRAPGEVPSEGGPKQIDAAIFSNDLLQVSSILLGVLCPIGSHSAKGMSLKLTVTAK